MTKSKRLEIEHDGKEFGLICRDHFLRKSDFGDRKTSTLAPLVREIQCTVNMGSAEKQQKWKDYRICLKSGKRFGLCIQKQEISKIYI